MARLSNAVKAARVVHNINKAALEINETMTRAAYDNYVNDMIRIFGADLAREKTGDKWSDVKLSEIYFLRQPEANDNAPTLDAYQAALRGEKIHLDWLSFERDHTHSFYRWSAREICKMFTLLNDIDSSYTGYIGFDLSGLTTEQALAYLYDLGFSSVEFAKSFLLLPIGCTDENNLFVGDKSTFTISTNYRINALYICDLTRKHGWDKVKTLSAQSKEDPQKTWSHYIECANWSSTYFGRPQLQVPDPWTI